MMQHAMFQTFCTYSKNDSFAASMNCIPLIFDLRWKCDNESKAFPRHVLQRHSAKKNLGTLTPPPDAEIGSKKQSKVVIRTTSNAIFAHLISSRQASNCRCRTQHQANVELNIRSQRRKIELKLKCTWTRLENMQCKKYHRVCLEAPFNKCSMQCSCCLLGKTCSLRKYLVHFFSDLDILSGNHLS